MVDSPLDICKVVCQNVKSDSGCTTSTLFRLYAWEVQSNWKFELLNGVVLTDVAGLNWLVDTVFVILILGVYVAGNDDESELVMVQDVEHQCSQNLKPEPCRVSCNLIWLNACWKGHKTPITSHVTLLVNESKIGWRRSSQIQDFLSLC